MGTTTSRDTTPDPGAVQGDVGAIFQGMTDDVIARQQARRTAGLSPQLTSVTPLPTQLDPGYKPPVPPAIQPQPQQSPAPWATPPLSQPSQVAVGTPRIQLTPQVVQPPPQLPPRTGERPPINNMPPLWNGSTVGPSGQTKQQFLVGRMMHESQGDPQALNYVARNDPRMYDQGYTAQGLLQDLNTTWAQGAKWAAEHPDQYPMSVDPRQFKTAREAPWDVQWQVNSAIYDHAGETPWKEPDGRGGFRGNPAIRNISDSYQSPDQRTPHQNYLPAEPRSFHQWGQEPTGTPARPEDTRGIFSKFAPLLLGIASLALRLPLSTAITAYGAAERAAQNGQNQEHERNRTKYQDAWKEAAAKQNLESQDYGDAFATYGENNPQGLQQTLAQLALKYNDPQMLRLAEQGDLNGAHRLQAQRDMLNQNLVKGSKALEEQQDRQAQDAAVAAMDQKWRAEHPDATDAEFAIAHNEHIGEAGRAGTKDPKGITDKPEQEGEVRDVLDKDGNRIRQVREGKTGGLFDLNGNPTTIDEKNGETLAQPGKGGAGGKDTTEGDYIWTNPDGSRGEGYAKIKGKQLVDAVTEEPIPIKPGTRVNKISTQSANQAGAGARGTPGKIEDWEGMNEGKPPPGVTEADWVQAQDWARLGRAPPGLSSRSGAYQGAHDALPYALHALGKTGADMPADAIDYQTRRVAAESTERYFASGMGARQLTALDTVAAHINLFREYAAAVKSGNVTAINEVAGRLATATGSPELIDMGIASTITGDEVIRLLTQTGGTRGDREDIKEKLSVYSSPEQFEGIANTLTNFVRERYDPLRQQYTNRLGATPEQKVRYEEAFKNKITPAARQIIENKQPIAGGAQVQPMTEEQYNSAPSGTRYRMPSDPPDTVRIKP